MIFIHVIDPQWSAMIFIEPHWDQYRKSDLYWSALISIGDWSGMPWIVFLSNFVTTCNSQNKANRCNSYANLFPIDGIEIWKSYGGPIYFCFPTGRIHVHSFPKETQHIWSCLSFAEECIPVSLMLYIPMSGSVTQVYQTKWTD